MCMKIKVVDSDKQKVLNRLAIARDFINTLINEEDIEKNWLTIHKVLTLARKQINMATHIMARRHLRVCLAKRMTEITGNTSNEIIKTFNYLG